MIWDRKSTHKVLEHIGAHLLFDTSLNASLEQELCGLCFHPSPLCIFYLRKGKGAGASQQVDIKKSRCPNLIKGFSYQSAAMESTSSPCTNVSLICPLCPSTSGAIWKYNCITCQHISEIVTHLHCRDHTHRCLLFLDQKEQALQRFGPNDMPRSGRKKELLNQEIHLLFLKLIALDESFRTSQCILQIIKGGLSCLLQVIN